MIRLSTVFLFFAAGSAFANEVLDRMDRSASSFRSLTADVRRIAHNGVINDDEIEEGSLSVKRGKGSDVRLLMNIQKPDQKSYAFTGKKLEIFLPKIATVQELDVGKHRGMLEQFFLLGFGTSRKDLERDYTVKVGGAETVGANRTTRVELVPRSAQVLQHMKRAELWIGDGGYPVQQKFYQSGGDYHIVTYANLKINPELADSALKLKLPANVKRENLQK